MTCVPFHTDVETTGQRIRKLRKARGWSLERCAKVAGISKDGLWQIEQDKREGPYTLEKIAVALGTTYAYLKFGDGEAAAAHLQEQGRKHMETIVARVEGREAVPPRRVPSS